MSDGSGTGARTLFVTGMQRSGTTLLDRLLSSHPGISILSQPFPLVFVEAKRAFLRSAGQPDGPYPLGPLFPERGYRPEALAGFLAGYRLDAGTLRAAFQAMSGFSGQYTRVDPAALSAVLEGLVPGDFVATITQLYRGLADRPDADVVGGKETLCEEFLPYLLARGTRCVVVTRDPRDVLASLNHGTGEAHAGAIKPTLFNVRNWRKSVAFALHLAGHPYAAWVRYEELVARPVSGLDRLADLLAVTPFAPELFAAGIFDRVGRPWRGNSSHGEHAGISQASVGSHRGLLPAAVTRYVEATCYPELTWLGYPVSLSWKEVPDVIRAFRDPYPLVRQDLSAYVSEPSARAAEELSRLELLAGAPGEASRSCFLFPDVHEALRAVVGPR